MSYDEQYNKIQNKLSHVKENNAASKISLIIGLTATAVGFAHIASSYCFPELNPVNPWYSTPAIILGIYFLNKSHNLDQDSIDRLLWGKINDKEKTNPI